MHAVGPDPLRQVGVQPDQQQATPPRRRLAQPQAASSASAAPEMPEHHAAPGRQSCRRLPWTRRPVRVGEEQQRRQVAFGATIGAADFGGLAR